MTESTTLPLIRYLSLATAALAALVAGYSLADPGIYRPLTPEPLMPGSLSQDIGTLICAGLVAFTVADKARNAAWWLIWAGAMAYLAYGYALYSFEALYNPLYLGYIAIFALSIWTLGLFATRSGIRVTASWPAPPRRATAILLILLTALFLMLWLSIMLPAMARREVPLASTIFVLDFSIVLPALAICALSLWQGRQLGDLLAVPLLMKSASIGLSVLGGTLLGPFYGLPIALEEVATYAVLGLLPPIFMALFLRRIRVSIG